MRWPICSIVSSPSSITPQLMSMSSSRRWYIGVLLASLIDGTGFAPNIEPRPVVKQIMFAPLAIWPVAEHGIESGRIHEHEAVLLSIGSAYSYTACSGVVPPFIAEPSDFSKMLASPPAWLPGPTTPLIWPLCPRVYSFHHASDRAASGRLRA